MGRKVIIGGISLILVGALLVGFNFVKDDKKVTSENKVESKTPLKGENGEIVTYSDSFQETLDSTYDRARSSGKFDYKQEDIYNLVHWLSNSVIEAKHDKKIGFLEPSPENLYKMKEILDKAPIPHQDFFKESLSEWEKGNFVEVEDVHNTAWKMLDGSIGKATGEDEFNINRLKEKYYK